MKITLKLLPKRSRNETTVSIADSVIVINGIGYDLSELPDGSTAYHPVMEKVERNGDEYKVTIGLGFGPNAHESTRYPEPIYLIDHHGKVNLPPYNID